MAERQIAFRLPLDGLPRAVFVTDYGLRHGRLIVNGSVVLEAPSRDSLEGGLSVELPGRTNRLTVRAVDDDVELSVDGVTARREDELRAPSSRSAWIHGWIALAGSAFGFIASYLYVLRANAEGDAWSMRMALHMAAWHLLLSLTLFPASVWGQRIGIRMVQATSLVFFVIHVAIAFSNAQTSGQRLSFPGGRPNCRRCVDRAPQWGQRFDVPRRRRLRPASACGYGSARRRSSSGEGVGRDRHTPSPPIDVPPKLVVRWTDLLA